MNQPKFKVGEVVKDDYGHIFKIQWINWDAATYFYIGDIKEGSWTQAPEKVLKLYQEPQKKKLYAWASRDGVVFHVKNENVGREVFYRLRLDAQSFERSPGDDIEYPETKVDSSSFK